MSGKPKLLAARIGAIGDICMLIPLVHALSRHYEVHWLIRSAHMPLLACFPFVACRPIPVANEADESAPFPDELVTELRAQDYACLIDFSHWPSVRRLARQLSSIPVRATTEDIGQDALLGIPPPTGHEAAAFTLRMAVAPGLHQIEKWRRLVQAACGIDIRIEWPLPPRSPVDPGRRPRLLLHPHAGKPEKIWPVDRFARVLVDLGRQAPVDCRVNKVRSRTTRALRWRLLFSNVRMTTIALDPTFRRLRSALGECDLAFGCDSGPMHFAALLGVPTLVIYGRYPAREFAPLWRSVAVSPPGAGLDADAVSTDAVLSALDKLIADLRSGLPAELGSVI